MYKIINYRCPECGYDKEIDNDEIQKENFICLCPKCKKEMIEFNFKNNSQVYKIPRDWN